MASYIPGGQATAGTQGILSIERKVDIPSELTWLRPENSPFVLLTSGKGGNGLPVKKKTAINPKYDILEKEPHGTWTAINNGAGYAAGATTFICDSVAHINIGDLLKVVGGEVVRVTARNVGANTITVTRSIGPTVAAIIADNTPLYRIGHAFGENAAIPTALMVKNRSRTSYTQIFRKAMEVSRTLQNSELHQGKKWSEIHREGHLEIMKEIERALIFSEPYEDLSGAEPIRTTAGLDYLITTGGGHVTTAAPAFTKAQWGTYCRNAFAEGSEIKVFLASPLQIEMLDFWKDGKLEMRPSDHVYDMRVVSWETGQGTFLIMRDRELQNSPYGSGAGFGGTGFGIDVEHIGQKVLSNSDLALYENVVRSGKDGRTDEYLAELGLWLELPEVHSKLENITTYV